MVTATRSDVEIRAWDLGGFGDIAGAMRTASHIQSGGLVTRLVSTSPSAADKLGILAPDVPVARQSTDVLQIDVAGHYHDSRTNQDPKKVPHIFSEDMDNPSDRASVVPVYIKSGLVPKGSPIGIEVEGQPGNPMFYRPFREWDLPRPGQVDVRGLIMEAAGNLSPAGLERILGQTDNIAFSHFKPHMSAEEFLNSPYVRALKEAAENFDGNFALGLFFNGNLEEQVAVHALSEGYSMIMSDGTVFEGEHGRPALVFLGPQPQLMTTSLFVSATMPNIVTGDLSLSDSLYALVAMGGQGFFYDCPSWKQPTYNELRRMLPDDAAQIFAAGSMGDFHNGSPQHIETVAMTLADPSTSERYTESMRSAVTDEIESRFGPMEIDPEAEDGFYVQRGAPYLFQDAAEKVMYALANSPESLARVEATRKRIAESGAVPVIAISGDVLIPEGYMNFSWTAKEDPEISSILAEMEKKYKNHNTILDGFGLTKDYNDLIKIEYNLKGMDNILKSYIIQDSEKPLFYNLNKKLPQESITHMPDVLIPVESL